MTVNGNKSGKTDHLANLQPFDEIAYMCSNEIRISEWFGYLLDQRDYDIFFIETAENRKYAFFISVP